jgi:hypothetical protein
MALAGILLVFAGFLIAKGDSFKTRLGDKYKWLAFSALIPVLIAIALSWLSIDALEGCQWAMYHLLTVLKIQLAFTALYAIIGLGALVC